MPHVQTEITVVELARLRTISILLGITQKKLMREFIVQGIETLNLTSKKEDETCLKKQPLKKQQNDPENS